MSPRNKNKIVIKNKKVNRKTAKRKRNSYSIEQKKQVVAYAKENGRNKAADAFNLDRSMVGRWIKANRLWVTGMNQSIKRIGSGRNEFYPEAEKKLYDWIIEQRKQGLGVTFDFARIEMFKILKEPDMRDLYGNSAKNFKASHRWMFAFMKRYGLSQRRRAKVSQKLPSQLERSLENFYNFITRLKQRKLFELPDILNMDETPVWFDMTGNFTIDHKGEKTIHIRGTGHEKNRFTVVLTCAAGKNFFYNS